MDQVRAIQLRVPNLFADSQYPFARRSAMIANGIEPAGIRKMSGWCYALRINGEATLNRRISDRTPLGEGTGSGKKTAEHDHRIKEPFNSHAIGERASYYRPVKINSC